MITLFLITPFPITVTMPMPPYTIYCYQPGCRNEAVYKIAARWTDGITEELKTYGLTCENCLPPWFRQSIARQAACRRSARETIDPPGVYLMERGQRDRRLKRLPELETQLLSPQ